MVAVNNAAIWINGNEVEYHWSDRTKFDEYVLDKLRPNQEDVFNIQEQINRHHKKTIKGNAYWYQWLDGKHISRGPVKGKDGKDLPDPRDPLRAKKAKLEAAITEQEKNMRSCIVKKSGKHLVFDVRIFKQYVDKKLPSSCIAVSEILNGKKS